MSSKKDAVESARVGKLVRDKFKSLASPRSRGYKREGRNAVLWRNW